MSDTCGFLPCYSYDKCQNPKPCPKHSTLKCSGCGRKATHECSYTGQFVCGEALCDNCAGSQGDFSKGLGWGFIGHVHKPKDVTSEVTE